MGNARPPSSHGSRTRQILTTGRESSASVARRRSYDLSYTGDEPAVQTFLNGPEHDLFQARHSQDHGKDPADLEIKTTSSTTPLDLLPFQTDYPHTRRESEQYRIGYQDRSRRSGESSSTNNIEVLDGGESRSKLARVSSEDMIEAQISERSQTHAHQIPRRRLSSTSPWPEEIVRGLHDLHKHRTRLSFYSQTFREQYEYVKDERNQLANVVAILLQEVGKAPGLILNGARIQALGEDIARRHALLAQTEADLDTMKDRVAQTERALQSVEADLCSYIISDKTSNDTDAVGDLCGSMLSESFITTDAASSVDYSEPKTEAVQVERTMQPQTSSHKLYRLHLTSQYSDSPPVATSIDPIIVDQPTFITGIELGLEETEGQLYWDFDLISLASIRQQQNATPELHWIGQHHWDRHEAEQIQSKDATLAGLLVASPLQIAKRQRDLGQLISHADDVVHDAEACSSSDSFVTAGITDQLLHVGRRSWLEFSRFVAYFNDFVREAVPLRALPFETIDSMLERISFADDDPDSRARLPPVSDDSSLSSIKLNVLNDALPSILKEPINESGKSNPEIFAWTTTFEVPPINSRSIYPTIDNALLTAVPTNVLRSHSPRPLSLPADLSKSDMNIVRFPTL